MLTPLTFLFYVYFISLVSVIAESVVPQIVTNTLRSNPPPKEDYGLESISEELPIVEPEQAAFRNPQVRFMSLNPAQEPLLRPEIPQTINKPQAKFPMPQANKKPPPKFPIPQAVMGPKLPRTPVVKKGTGVIAAAKAPARAGNPAPKLIGRQQTPRLRVRPSRGDLHMTSLDVKLKVLHLMEQVLYHTQDGNLVQVEEMAVKYQQTPQYRMVFIVLKMEEVKNEMHSIFTYLNKNCKNVYDPKCDNIKVVQHIYYYTHMLQKNIDITYAVEYLLEHFSEL